MSLPSPSTTDAASLTRDDSLTSADSSCAFCNIAASFPPPPPAAPLAAPTPSPATTYPRTHIIASSASVIAFLDILPLTRCHVLVCPRRHVEKLSALRPSESGVIGAWLAVVARAVCAVSGMEDFNVVQNNGVNAAQVVPHVHYHIIPRPDERQREELAREAKTAGVAGVANRYWRSPFGDGWRTELDDDQGAELAAQLREKVYAEIEALESDAAGKRERVFLASL